MIKYENMTRKSLTNLRWPLSESENGFICNFIVFTTKANRGQKHSSVFLVLLKKWDKRKVIMCYLSENILWSFLCLHIVPLNLHLSYFLHSVHSCYSILELPCIFFMCLMHYISSHHLTLLKMCLLHFTFSELCRILLLHLK